MSVEAKQEIAAGACFAFGANWARFLETLDGLRRGVSALYVGHGAAGWAALIVQPLFCKFPDGWS